MTDSIILYILVWVLSLLVILSFAIGLEKMIKVIIWNYILWLVALAFSMSIDIAIGTVNGEGFMNFLTNAKSTIVFIVYAMLLFLLYHKSKINIDIPGDQILQKSMYIFLVPLTVISMILTLEIVFLGTDVFNYNDLVYNIDFFANNEYFQLFVEYTPYWILLHWLATIVTVSEFKTKIRSDLDDI